MNVQADLTNEFCLRVEELTTQFRLPSGQYVSAVNKLSFDLRSGEILALVGESGCGKSVTSLSIMGLIDAPAGRIANGRVQFEGRDLLTLSEKELNRIRGRDLAMIFQDPMTSLNPVFPVGDQIAEVLRIHEKLGTGAAKERAIDMLAKVQIADPQERYNAYPHQLSGGMRQRVMIAMALACKPKLLIADEPTTALDVTIQAQIIALISSLQSEFGMSVLFITHDLALVREFCHRVMVMYAGRIVESATVAQLFSVPRHPYTKGLLGSVPQLGRKLDRLPTIRGSVPSLASLGKGCAFYGRCDFAQSRCSDTNPELESYDRGVSHSVACWNQVQGD